MLRSMFSVLIPVLAFTISASVRADGERLYVRPYASPAPGAVYDGSSYDRAFNGFANVSFSGINTAGSVDPGDTLVVCGSFDANSAAVSGTKMLLVGASGSGTKRIVIEGDCSSKGDLSRAVLDGQGGLARGVDFSSNGYITLRNMTVRNFTSRGLLISASSSEYSNNKYVELSNLRVSNISGTGTTIGIDARGAYLSMRDIQIGNIGDAGIYVDGNNLELSDSFFARVGEGPADSGDCV